MSILLSGSKLRTGGSEEFLQLANAQPQLPTTNTSTGFTLITNELLQTRYASSLGNIEFNQSTMYSNQSTGTITIFATGTVSVSTSTASGTLVVTGGVGIGRNLWVKEDIHVNDLTIGRGYEGKNNIVFKGDAETVLITAGGQENIVIGYDNLKNIATAYKTVSIGSHVFSTGTNITESIAIGHGTMENLGIIHSIFVGNITNITQTNPVVIEIIGHGLTTGTNIIINDVIGMTELNNNEYYVRADDADHLSLYSDIILANSINGTGYTAYSNNGTIGRVVNSSDNISIGNDSLSNIIDGKNNLILGNRSARDLNTGSYNFFLGTEVGNNLTNVNGIISIGSENIQDGVDDQIGIGSVFYYNGLGSTNIVSNLRVGLGEDSTSTVTGAFQVVGGVGVTESVYSQDGNPQENYLLYTPRVFVADIYSAPTNPRVGDFWINTDTYAYLQYIKDGDNFLWIQVSSI